MEKIHGNVHVFMLSCKFLRSKHKKMCVSMYMYCVWRSTNTMATALILMVWFVSDPQAFIACSMKSGPGNKASL